MNIQIESFSMVYENEEVALVKVEHTVRGKVLRSGRGTLELTAAEYEGNELVPKLEQMIHDALIAELEEVNAE